VRIENNEQINKRLASAIAGEGSHPEDETEEPDVSSPDEKLDLKSRIVTTEEELEGFFIVKSILREVVDSNRIAHRDTLNYFGILLDDNRRKPIRRLHFNRPEKYVSIFGENKKEKK
jgi:hypothetical protein